MSGFYPEVVCGDDILWATGPDTPGPQWRLGRVVVSKNQSCDLIVYTANGDEYHHDCLHKDDPRCYKSKDHLESGRGVFQLTAGELAKREQNTGVDLSVRIPSLEYRVAAMERALDRLVLGNAAQAEKKQRK